MNFLASGVTRFDDEDHLLIADDRRLWTSIDYGQTWQGRSLPLPMDMHAVDLLAARADGLVIAGWRGPRIPGDWCCSGAETGGRIGVKFRCHCRSIRQTADSWGS